MILDVIDTHVSFHGKEAFDSSEKGEFFREEVDLLNQQLIEMAKELAAKYNVEVKISM